MSGRVATAERTEPPESPAPRSGSRRRGRLGDRVFRSSTGLLAVGLIALLALLLYVLGSDGAEALGRYGLSFVIGRDWNPVAGREEFGALPFIFTNLKTGEGLAQVIDWLNDQRARGLTASGRPSPGEHGHSHTHSHGEGSHSH